MIAHASLQDTTNRGPVSGSAAALAAEILDGAIGLEEAVARAAAHLLSDPRVDAVATALTSFAPEEESDWVRLGGRAWLREWSLPGARCSILPPPGAGAEAALSMPWLSQWARTDVIALIDCELLPEEAAQDRVELARVDVRSLIGTAFVSMGEMHGSLSAVSIESGQWPDALIEDLRLLTTAVSTRFALERSRRALAEAIESGRQAQLAYQNFFGAVGHELRTPIAAILGHTEVLLDEAQQSPDDQVVDALKRSGPVILRASEQLVAVVDSLLGAGRTLASDDQRQGVDVADAVADVAHWHRTPAQAAGVEVQVEVSSEAAVWAHPSAVRQVLTNLVGNAITHHHPSGGTVRLSTERLLGESGREMVRIIVRDDGPGLTPDQLQRVFEPFVRFAGNDTKGSGLGLSLSRTIAERDGGAVRGESTCGVGSSFWLELPAFRPVVA